PSAWSGSASAPGPIDSSESHDGSRRKPRPPPARSIHDWSRAKHHELGVKRAARHFRQFQLKDVTGWGAVRYRHHTPQLVGVRSTLRTVVEGGCGMPASNPRPGLSNMHLALANRSSRDF